jgi:hypothetical protein
MIYVYKGVLMGIGFNKFLTAFLILLFIAFLAIAVKAISNPLNLTYVGLTLILGILWTVIMVKTTIKINNTYKNY